MSRIHFSPDTTFTLQSTAFPRPVYVRSIFHTHQLHSTDLHINQLRKTQPDWVLAILVICFILIAWTQVFYPKRIQQVIRAPFSKRFINQLTRDGNLFSERITIAMGLVYLLTFSLFLYEINEQILGFSFQRIHGLALYGILAVMIVAIMAAKVALVQLLGTIFKTRETTGNYLLNLLIFALLSGPVLLVSLIFIVYMKSVIAIYICLVIYILLLIFRFLRGFFIGMALTKFSYLFLFVYLCSLEILPLLVLLKILLNIAQATGA